MRTFLNALKRMYLSRQLGSVGKNLNVDFTAYIKQPKKMFFGKNVIIGSGVYMQPNPKIKIGDDTAINANSVLMGKVSIGKNCMIAPLVIIAGGNHNYRRVDVPIKSQSGTEKGVVIEDDVWIGGNVSIVDGVKIGRGAVVGAGSVVTKNVEEFSVVVGNPAKKIKSRKK